MPQCGLWLTVDSHSVPLLEKTKFPLSMLKAFTPTRSRGVITRRESESSQPLEICGRFPQDCRDQYLTEKLR